MLEVLERRVAERHAGRLSDARGWLGEYRFYVDERVIVPRSHIAVCSSRLHAWMPEPECVQRSAGSVHRLRLSGHLAGADFSQRARSMPPISRQKPCEVARAQRARLRL